VPGIQLFPEPSPLGDKKKKKKNRPKGKPTKPIWGRQGQGARGGAPRGRCGVPMSVAGPRCNPRPHTSGQGRTPSRLGHRGSGGVGGFISFFVNFSSNTNPHCGGRRFSPRAVFLGPRGPRGEKRGHSGHPVPLPQKPGAGGQAPPGSAGARTNFFFRGVCRSRARLKGQAPQTGQEFRSVPQPHKRGGPGPLSNSVEGGRKKTIFGGKGSAGPHSGPSIAGRRFFRK